MDFLRIGRRKTWLEQFRKPTNQADKITSPPNSEQDIKELLIQAGASQSVLDAVNRQRPRHGYIARQLNDLRENRAGAQAVAEQERESHHQRCRDGG